MNKDPLGIADKQALILRLRHGFRTDSSEQCLASLMRQSNVSSVSSPPRREPSPQERDE
jgi:hypothetical protein